MSSSVGDMSSTVAAESLEDRRGKRQGRDALCQLRLELFHWQDELTING